MSFFRCRQANPSEKTVSGSVSLFARSKSIASAGIEIWQDERRRGYVSEGIKLVLEKARHQGYRVIQNQVSADNLPSIALHEKPGFETNGYICRNARDRSVFLFTYCL